MKYQNLSAFEKHLEQAAKMQLSRVYLVVSSCPYERKKIVEKIVSALQAKEPSLHLQNQDAAQGPLEEKIDSLNTSSLFTGKQAVYLDGIDKVKKNGLAVLASYVERPSPFAYLILGAASSKSLADLYAKGKKEVVACDLSEEKPWDRKDRLKRSLLDFAAKSGKRVSAEALEYLLENVGMNLAGLEQELIKVVTYAGERRDIALQDVRALCAVQKSATLWQCAEAMVWRDGPVKIDDDIEIFPLISSMKTQLQNGLAIAVLLERGTAHRDLAHHFPTLKPAVLDKMLPIAKARQSPFFKRALGLLFDAELMAKNSSFEPAFILDVLLSKLTLLKHAVSLSQSPR